MTENEKIRARNCKMRDALIKLSLTSDRPDDWDYISYLDDMGGTGNPDDLRDAAFEVSDWQIAKIAREALTCPGIEIVAGKWSGCDAAKTGERDCPTCG